MSYNKLKNKDVGVTERNIIVSLLSLLDNSLQYDIVRKDNAIEVVKIPFYFSLGGDGTFMYDRFLKPMFGNKELAEQNYEPVPRGIITLTSTGIAQNALVNDSVFAEYQKKDEKGNIKTYRAKYRPIPIVMSFDCVVIVTATLDLFKISETIKQQLYKSTVFRVQSDTIPIGATLTMPEAIEKTKLIEYSFEDDQKVRIEYSFDVTTWIPNFDSVSEVFVGKRMQAGLSNNIQIGNNNQAYTVTVDGTKDDPNNFHIPNDGNMMPPD